MLYGLLGIEVLLLLLIVPIYHKNKIQFLFGLIEGFLTVLGIRLVYNHAPKLGILFVLLYILLKLIIIYKIITGKTYFGNYCIVSPSFIVNAIVNKSKKNEESINIGTIVPMNKWDLKYNGRAVVCDNDFLTRGTLITGSTGSGKTYGTKKLIKQDFANGSPVIYFDFKGDKKLRKELIKEASEYGYDIYCYNEEGYEYFMDPLASLTENGRIEAIVNSRKWDPSGRDDHYKKNLKVVTQHYVQEFDKFIKARVESGEIDFNEYEYTKNLYTFIKGNKPDLSKRAVSEAYETLITLFELTLNSEAGETFTKSKNPRVFSFINKNEIRDFKYLLIISIPSESKELADTLTSFYLASLMSGGIQVDSYERHIKLYMDETGTLQNIMVVKDMVEKGRSLRICATLIMQDISQIVVSSSEAFLDTLLSTLNNFIIYAGCTKKSAEKISGTQIKDIDKILMSLRIPNHCIPTALFISKSSCVNTDRTSEVYKIFPYDDKINVSKMFKGKPDKGNKNSKNKNKESLLDLLFIDDAENGLF